MRAAGMAGFPDAKDDKRSVWRRLIDPSINGDIAPKPHSRLFKPI
jgi:hypothetical protein